MHKFDFGWGSALDPAGGAYSTPPDPLDGFKGPTSQGKDSKGREWEKEGNERGKGKRVDGEGIDIVWPNLYATPLR